VGTTLNIELKNTEQTNPGKIYFNYENIFTPFQFAKTGTRPVVSIPLGEDMPNVRQPVEKPHKADAIQKHQSRFLQWASYLKGGVTFLIFVSGGLKALENPRIQESFL
jgi:hypothetical protein